MAERRQIVLLVDDNETNLDLLSRRLDRKGYTVLCAASGREALEILAREAVDLVLLDVMMPEMSGLEVLELLRRTRGPHELPVIMATAKAEGADVVAALDSGANDYVTKPIDLDVLLARMRVHLRRPALPTVPEVMPDAYVGPGAVLEGKYRLEAALGSGGFGTVYRAVHLALQKDVAIKILHAHLVESASALRRFQQEGISGCRVRHPNAVAMLDSGSTAAGVPFLVMELLEGPSLQLEIERRGALPLRRCAEILAPICDVLIEAHRAGIVHRDIKPANILLSVSPAGEVVKVLDFGIAKLVERDGPGPLTVGDAAGTPYFMAPERLIGRASGAKSDIYSVGVTLYQMLSGTLPFGRLHDNPYQQALQQVQTPPIPLEQVRADLPEDVGRLVMACLAMEPEHRPDLETLRSAIVGWAAQWVEPAWPPPGLAAFVPEFAETRDASADRRTTVGGGRIAVRVESASQAIGGPGESGEVASAGSGADDDVDVESG